MTLWGHIPGRPWMSAQGFSHDVRLTIFNEETGVGEVVVAPDHHFQVHSRTEEPRLRYLEVLGMEEVFPGAGIKGSLVLCEKGQAWWSPKDRATYICDLLW